uniref:Uncharacterized protein n=1 Tax=Xenopus tropicalis TaxID=8364 RepID=A0A1B8Y3V3_XENTR
MGLAESAVCAHGTGEPLTLALATSGPPGPLIFTKETELARRSRNHLLSQNCLYGHLSPAPLLGRSYSFHGPGNWEGISIPPLPLNCAWWDHSQVHRVLHAYVMDGNV